MALVYAIEQPLSVPNLPLWLLSWPLDCLVLEACTVHFICSKPPMQWAVRMQQWWLANYPGIAPGFTGFIDMVPCSCGVSKLANSSLALKLHALQMP